MHRARRMKKLGRWILVIYVGLSLLAVGMYLSGRPGLEVEFRRVAAPSVPHNFAVMQSYGRRDKFELLGFRISTFHMWYGGPSMNLYRSTTIPAWPAVAGGLGVAAWWIARRTGPLLADLRIGRRVRGRIERQRKCGRCPHCGYDIRATPDRCPECGIVPKVIA